MSTTTPASVAAPRDAVTDERLRNLRAWAAARVGTMAGAGTIVAAIDELLRLRQLVGGSDLGMPECACTTLRQLARGRERFAEVPNHDARKRTRSRKVQIVRGGKP